MDIIRTKEPQLYSHYQSIFVTKKSNKELTKALVFPVPPPPSSVAEVELLVSRGRHRIDLQHEPHSKVKLVAKLRSSQ